MRDELQVAAGRDAFQACGFSFLIQAAGDAAGVLRPKRIFVVAGDATVQQNAPGLRIAGGETQAAKGNRDPHHKAPVGYLSLRIPNRVEREIEILTFGPERVGLHAQRVGEKGVRAPMIVEGVEHDLDGVVIDDVFAPGKPGANLLRFSIKTDENGIQVLSVVAKVDLSLLR